MRTVTPSSGCGRRRRRRFAAAPLTLFLVLGACGQGEDVPPTSGRALSGAVEEGGAVDARGAGADGQGAAGGTTSTLTTTTTARPAVAVTTTGTTASELVEEVLSLPGLPRQVTFGAMTVTVSGVKRTNVDAQSLGLAGEPRLGDRDLYVVQGMVENPIAARNWLVPPSTSGAPFALSVDGRRVPALRMVSPGGGSIGILEPERAVEFLTAFDAADVGDVSRASFIVGPAGYEPAEMALSGPATDRPYPQVVALGSPAPAQGSGTGCRQRLTVTPADVALVLDNADPSHQPRNNPALAFMRRAPEGRRLALATLTVHNHGGSICGGGRTNFDGNDVRLVVDGVPLGPLAGSIATIDVEAAQVMSYLFDLPATAKAIELQVGSASATLASFPLDLTGIDLSR